MDSNLDVPNRGEEVRHVNRKDVIRGNLCVTGGLVGEREREAVGNETLWVGGWVGGYLPRAGLSMVGWVGGWVGTYRELDSLCWVGGWVGGHLPRRRRPGGCIAAVVSSPPYQDCPTRFRLSRLYLFLGCSRLRGRRGLALGACPTDPVWYGVGGWVGGWEEARGKDEA